MLLILLSHLPYKLFFVGRIRGKKSEGEEEEKIREDDKLTADSQALEVIRGLFENFAKHYPQHSSEQKIYAEVPLEKEKNEDPSRDGPSAANESVRGKAKARKRKPRRRRRKR